MKFTLNFWPFSSEFLVETNYMLKCVMHLRGHASYAINISPTLVDTRAVGVNLSL